MIDTLLNNPGLAIVVLIVAVILGKLIKLSAKVLKWVVLIGLAYVVVNFIGIG